MIDDQYTHLFERAKRNRLVDWVEIPEFLRLNGARLSRYHGAHMADGEAWVDNWLDASHDPTRCAAAVWWDRNREDSWRRCTIRHQSGYPYCGHHRKRDLDDRTNYRMGDLDPDLLSAHWEDMMERTSSYDR